MIQVCWHIPLSNLLTEAGRLQKFKASVVYISKISPTHIINISYTPYTHLTYTTYLPHMNSTYVTYNIYYIHTCKTHEHKVGQKLSIRNLVCNWGKRSVGNCWEVGTRILLLGWVRGKKCRERVMSWVTRIVPRKGPMCLYLAQSRVWINA